MPRVIKLTPLHSRIITLLAQCYQYKEVADILSITTKAVAHRCEEIYSHHGFHTHAELIHYAIKNGIVQAGEIRPKASKIVP